MFIFQDNVHHSIFAQFPNLGAHGGQADPLVINVESFAEKLDCKLIIFHILSHLHYCLQYALAGVQHYHIGVQEFLIFAIIDFPAENLA